MSLPLRVRNIPYSIIDADLKATRILMDTMPGASFRSDRFCTARHHREEIERLVPSTSIFTHEPPPWGPYGYTLWRPLIAKSQNMSESHVFIIPSFLREDFLKCHARWTWTGRVTDEQAEDIADMWLSCKAGAGLRALFTADGSKRWFFRLDQASAKDSPYDDQSVRSVTDLVKRMCTSMRIYDCLVRYREDTDQDEEATAMKLILNPWDTEIDPTLEYRIFVPPPAARGVANATLCDLQIAAISQYRWFRPFTTPGGLTVAETARKVYADAQKVLEEIKAFAKSSLGPEISQKLVKYGISFDVFLRGGKRTELVELNPFGAMGGLGGSLYNWEVDGRAMYGLVEEAEFLVTLED